MGIGSTRTVFTSPQWTIQAGASPPQSLSETLTALQRIIEEHLADPRFIAGRLKTAVSTLRDRGFELVSPDRCPQLDGAGITILQSALFRARLVLDRGDFFADLAHPAQPDVWYGLPDLDRVLSGASAAVPSTDPIEVAREILERASLYRDLLGDLDRLRDAGIAHVNDAVVQSTPRAR